MSDNENNAGVDTAEGKSPAEKISRRRHWRRIAAIVVIAVLVVIIFLPLLISSPPVRALVVGKLNSRIPGSVGIEKWSFSWFSKIRMEGISLLDAEGETVAGIESVTVNRGIAGLLTSPRNFGELEISAPELDLVLYADKGNNLLSALRTSSATAGKKSSSRAGSGSDVSSPGAADFTVSGKVIIRDGRISLRIPQETEGVNPEGINIPKGADTVILNGLNVELELDLPGKPVHLNAAGLLGKADAPVKLGLVVEPPFDSANFAAESNLSISGLELGDFSALMSYAGFPLTLSGRLDSEFSMQMSGIEKLHLIGKLSSVNLVAAGALLGDDRPRLASGLLDFDISRNGQRLEVTRLVAESSLANASAEGSIILPSTKGDMPSGDFSTSLRVHLAKLAAELPRTLRLHRGISPVGGELSVDARLSSIGESASAVFNARLEDLAAMNKGERLSLDQPISADLKISLSERAFEIEKVSLKSSFMNASGRGSQDDFSIDLSSDLAMAQHELGKFVDLQEMRTGGIAKLSLRAQSRGENVHHLDGRLNLEQISLTGLSSRPLSLDQASLELEADTEFPETPDVSREFRKIRAEFKSSPLNAVLNVDRFLLKGDGGLARVEGGRIKLISELADIAGFAVAMGKLPSDISFGGKSQISSELSIIEGLLSVRDFSLLIDSPSFRSGDKQFSDAKFALQAELDADLAKRVVDARGIGIEFAGGNLGLTRLHIPDWKMILNGSVGQFSGEFDLKHLRTAFRDFIPTPADVGISGNLSFQGEAAAAGADRLQLTMNSELAQFAVSRAGKRIHREDKLSMKMQAFLDSRAGNLDIPSLSLNSEIMSLKSKVAMQDLRAERKLFSEGRLICDFDRLGLVAAAISGKPLIISGKHDGTFKLTSTLSAKTMRELILSSSLESADIRVEQLGYDQFVAADVHFPLALSDGVARADLTGSIGGGSIHIPATVDAGRELPAMILPVETRILNDVDLSNELVNWLLSRFLPVFNGISEARGKVGITARECLIPIDGDIVGGIRFDGDLSFADGEMEAAGILRDVLVLAGISRQRLTLPDQTVASIVRDGKASHETLRFMVGPHPVIIDGVIDLKTQAIDYRIGMPVTREMLGDRSDLYALLKEETIEVRVVGTAKSPTIDRDDFRKTLSRIIRSAGERLLREKGGELLRRGLQDLLK